MSVVNSYKWSVLAEFVGKSIQPIVYLILAGILAPSEFGVVSTAMMVVSLCQILWEAGLNKSIIQIDIEYLEDAKHTAFWISAIVGVGVICVVWLISDFIANALFQSETVELVLKVMGVQILFSSLCCVHSGILLKNMEFRKLFSIRIVAVFIPGLITIFLALVGAGLWSIVLANILGALFQLIYLWTEWRPKWRFSIELAKKLLGFGKWVAFSAILSWFFVWFDSFFVGIYYGTEYLGVYRLGNQIIASGYGLIFGALVSVLYSYFSKIKNDVRTVKNDVNQMAKTVASFSIPIATFLFFMSDQLVNLIFGSQWLGMHLVFGVFAIIHGLSWIVGVNGEAYRALGLPHIETQILCLCCALYFLGYLIFSQFDFEVFVWGRLILTLIGVSIHLLYAHYLLGGRVFEILMHCGKVFALFIPMMLCLHYLNKMDGLAWLLFFGSGVYILVITYFLEKKRASVLVASFGIKLPR